MKELSVLLNLSGEIPIYEQIYEYIRGEIRKENLKADTKLPSTRALAEYLNVSRSTVLLAYDQLVSEGYIEARPCRGYFVLQIEGLYHLNIHSRNREVRKQTVKEEYQIDFSPSGIELDNFPYNAWRKVSRNVMQMEEKELFNIGDPRGDYELRQTIAAYLHESRGVNCSPDNIVVGAGDEYLLMLLDQLLVAKAGRHLCYAMENPAYRKAFFVITGIGRRVVPVGLDEYGMRKDVLEQSGSDIAYVTPSHQYPLGTVMSIRRRMELLGWANELPDRYIIEDDYDSEFRYRGKPIPALQGLDSNGKVIYIGTFSKSIAPGLRMSYMVLPEGLMECYDIVGRRYSNTVSRIDQNIVNLFIEGGYYERHLNKMRGIYKVKHDLLLSSLKKLGKEYMISGESAGLHVLLSSKTLNEEEMIRLAANAGVRLYPLSECYIGPMEEAGDRNTVILGYARLSEKEIVSGIGLIGEAFNAKNM